MSKRKLSAKEKAEKARRRELFMWVFVRGKQVRVRRPPTVKAALAYRPSSQQG